MHIIAAYCIAALGIITFALELWTGCAIAGWAGDKAIVRRDRTPGPYWFVILRQVATTVAGAMVYMAF